MLNEQKIHLLESCYLCDKYIDILELSAGSRHREQRPNTLPRGISFLTGALGTNQR